MVLPEKNKLIIILGILLLTGFIITSLGSYYVSRASLRSQISRHQLPITSDNIYSEIQRDLLRPIFISSLMASDTFLRDWVISGESDSTRVINYLREIQDRYNTFTSFFVSDKTQLYYQSGGILKKVSPDEERDAWYYRVRKMEPEFEINVDPDMANRDAMTIFVNYRVFDYEGNYIGATGVGLTVSAVKDIIETYQEKYGCNVYFVDPEGILTLYSSSYTGDAHSIRDMEGISSIADNILRSKDVSMKYTKNGSAIYVNSRYIKEFDWILIVEKTDRYATRNILRTLLINLLICSAITTVVLIMTNLSISVYQKQLEKMATIDKLTGRFNRQAFDIILGQNIRESDRMDTPFSILWLDIDNFKRVNDSYGHIQGDAVLKNVGDACRSCIRESDVVCRWGGEEFILLLRDCTVDDAVTMAEKIRHTIESTQTKYGADMISVTASIGVTQYRGSKNIDILLGCADKALYKAKQNGKNQVVSCKDMEA